MSDLISRKDAIDTIHKTIYVIFGYKDGKPFTDTDELLLMVNKLLCKKIREIPTADVVERKKGEWLDMGSGQVCSECHEIQYGYDNYRRYCANCGARMEVKTC